VASPGFSSYVRLVIQNSMRPAGPYRLSICRPAFWKIVLYVWSGPGAISLHDLEMPPLPGHHDLVPAVPVHVLQTEMRKASPCWSEWTRAYSFGPFRS